MAHGSWIMVHSMAIDWPFSGHSMAIKWSLHGQSRKFKSQITDSKSLALRTTSRKHKSEIADIARVCRTKFTRGDAATRAL
eukprot:6069240-Lingulodinium_polyedra.AAC.1